MTGVPGKILAKYGTRDTITTVREAAGGGFIWYRRSGPLRITPLSSPHPKVREEVFASIPKNQRTYFSIAGEEKQPLCYESWGDKPLPVALEVGLRGGEETAIELFRSLGILIKNLHSLKHVDVKQGSFSPLRRLRKWFHEGGMTSDARRFHQTSRKRMGELRFEELMSWADHMEDKDKSVLVHGNLATASIIPGTFDNPHTVLAGEEFRLGNWTLDVCWLLGELAELDSAFNKGLDKVPEAAYQRYAEAFIDGYGSVPDMVERQKIAALRTMAHMKDFTEFVGWPDDIIDYIDISIERIEQAQAILPG